MSGAVGRRRCRARSGLACLSARHRPPWSGPTAIVDPDAGHIPMRMAPRWRTRCNDAGADDDGGPTRRRLDPSGPPLRRPHLLLGERRAARARRPTDVVLLIIAIVVVVFLSLPAPGPTAIDSAVADLLAAIPGLLGWFWEISYDLLFLWTVFIFAGTLFAHGRMRLFWAELLAGLLGVAFAAGAGGLSGTAVEDSHPFVRRVGPPGGVSGRPPRRGRRGDRDRVAAPVPPTPVSRPVDPHDRSDRDDRARGRAADRRRRPGSRPAWVPRRSCTWCSARRVGGSRSSRSGRRS